MVRAMASGARAPRFDHSLRGGKIGVRTRFSSCRLQGLHDSVHRPSDRDVTWRTPLQGQSLCRLKIDPTQVLSYLRILSRSISIHNTRQISTTNRGCTKTVHFQFKLSFLLDLKPPWCSFLTDSLYGTRIKEEEKKIVCQGEVFLPFPFMAL